MKQTTRIIARTLGGDQPTAKELRKRALRLWIAHLNNRITGDEMLSTNEHEVLCARRDRAENGVVTVTDVEAMERVGIYGC